MNQQKERVTQKETPLKQDLKHFLEDAAIIERGEQGEIIVDIDYLQDLEPKEVNDSLGYDKKPRDKGRFSRVQKPWIKTMVQMFEGKQVHHENDSDTAELFYTAKSEKEAFDPETIKQKEFYLFPEDLLASKKDKQAQLKSFYEERNLSLNAVSLASRIYHPEYGDGYRDKETGKLMVYSEKNDGYIPISLEWIQKESGAVMASENGKKLWDSPYKALDNPAYQQLAEFGILSKNDFKERKKRTLHTELDTTFKKPTKKGLVMIDNVRYSLGTFFKSSKIKRLDGNTYGIYNEGNDLTHFFSTLPVSEIDKIKKDLEKEGKNTSAASFVVKKNQIHIQPASEYRPKKHEKADDKTLFRRQATIGPIGQVYLQGVFYNLGKEYADKKVVELADDFYGILNEDNPSKIDYWFRSRGSSLSTRKEQQQQRVDSGEIRDTRIYLSKSKNEIDLQGYKEQDNNHPLANESIEQYAQRLAALKHINEISSLGDELAEIAGIGIHHLPYREQQWLATYCLSSENRKQRVFSFAKEFGLEGLKTFMVTEYGTGIGDTILDISENLPKQQATLLFKKYAEITEQVEIIDQKLGELYDAEHNEEVIASIVRNVFDRAKKILLNYGEQALKKDRFSKKELQSFEEELKQVNTEVTLFAAMFAKLKEIPDLQLENLENVTINITEAGELSNEEKEDLFRLYKRVRTPIESPELVELGLHFLNERMSKHPDSTEIHRLFVKDKLIAFLRYDLDQEGVAHLASVNSSPDAKGASIGEEFLKTSILQKNRDHLVEAEMIPGKALVDLYVNKIGFSITGIEQAHGMTFYTIALLNQPVQKSISLTMEEILNLDEKTKEQLENGEIIIDGIKEAILETSSRYKPAA